MYMYSHATRRTPAKSPAMYMIVYTNQVSVLQMQKKKTPDKAVVVYSRFSGLHGRAELIFLAWSGRLAFVWQCLAACLARLRHVTERWTEQLVDGG